MGHIANIVSFPPALVVANATLVPRQLGTVRSGSLLCDGCCMAACGDGRGVPRKAPGEETVAQMHTWMDMHKCMCMHVHMHVHMHAYTHTHARTRVHEEKKWSHTCAFRAHLCMHLHACSHAYMPTCTRAQMHTCTHIGGWGSGHHCRGLPNYQRVMSILTGLYRLIISSHHYLVESVSIGRLTRWPPLMPRTPSLMTSCASATSARCGSCAFAATPLCQLAGLAWHSNV